MAPRMCEAHPCTDEPDGTSVAQIPYEVFFMLRWRPFGHESWYEKYIGEAACRCNSAPTCYCDGARPKQSPPL